MFLYHSYVRYKKHIYDFSYNKRLWKLYWNWIAQKWSTVWTHVTNKYINLRPGYLKIYYLCEIENVAYVEIAIEATSHSSWILRKRVTVTKGILLPLLHEFQHFWEMHSKQFYIQIKLWNSYDRFWEHNNYYVLFVIWLVNVHSWLCSFFYDCWTIFLHFNHKM